MKCSIVSAIRHHRIVILLILVYLHETIQFGKTGQLHFKLHTQKKRKKRKHERVLNAVSLNKCDSI